MCADLTAGMHAVITGTTIGSTARTQYSSEDVFGRIYSYRFMEQNNKINKYQLDLFVFFNLTCR